MGLQRAPTGAQQEGKAMLQKSLILAFVLVSVPAVGLAQDDVRARGDRACKSDVTRLCRKVMDQSDGVVLACLQQNARKLGATCRRFLQEQGQL